MGSFSLSPGALVVHIAGVIAVSQLVLSGSKSHQDFYQHLNNHNATGILHEAFDRLTIFLPVGRDLVGLGTLLQALVYLTATLYAFYLAR